MSDIDKKAYEIAYALCRIGEKAGEPLSGVLSNKGLQLLAAVVERYRTAVRTISVLGYFIKLGAGLDRVSQTNVDLLLGQFNLLADMLRDEARANPSSSARLVEEVDLSDVFPDKLAGPELHSARAPKNEAKEMSSTVNAESEDPILVIEKNESREVRTNKPSAIKEEGDNSFTPLISSDIRQSEILDLIRQSGNCRMKDLQDMFPRCSERTLRYDIESLIGRGLIERIGAGSATSYQPADLASFSRSPNE